MFVIRRLQELARKKRIPLYICFIDLTKAYDSVVGTFFWTVHSSFGVSQNMISVIRQFYDGMRACVRLDDRVCSGWFTATVQQDLSLLRVRARAPPVQHLLRGGYKRGLYAFQGGQRYNGRFGAPEEGRGGGRKQLPESQF